MDQEHSITKHVKGKHLNYTERVFIEIRLSDGWSAYRIAKALGCASNTVRNEIRRGTIELYHGSVKRYKASVGQQQYLQNRLNSRKPLKLFSCEAFLEYVVSCFFDPVRHWSLDACFGRALLDRRFDRSEMVCTKTLYRYVGLGLLPVKNIDLPQKLRRKTAGTRTRKHRVLFGRSIGELPSSYAYRRHFGHWEIDTVIGRKQGQNPVLLTLTERQTNYTIVQRIACKQADAVMEGLSRIREEYGEAASQVFRSILSDNGREFCRLPELEAEGTEVFYAHPYTAGERGSNERHNGLIRRFLPKGRRIETCRTEEIDWIGDWMNGLPRKGYGYRTPEELFEEQLDIIYRSPA